MSWSVIERKVASLRASLNEWELQSLEREFIEIINRIPRASRLARSIRGILFVDVTYALSQHRDWLQTPVFSVLLVEFLQLDHGLARNDAELVVHDMVEAGIQLGLGRPRALYCSDRDFLTWAYVCAANANDESSLELELGLGTAVLNKLRDGINALECADKNVFVPEYDAMLAAIVIDLSQAAKAVPWAMDFERIKFALLSGGAEAAQPYILPDSLPVLLDALIAIGRGDKYTLLERPALADLLVRSGMLVEVKASSRQKRQGHALTDLGARLTGLKVALTIEEGFTESDFFKFSSRWQQLVVKKSTVMQFDFLKSVVTTSMNKLAPEVLEAILAKMLINDPSRIDGPLVRQLLGAAPLAWHKAAVIRALRGGRPSPDLLEVVAGELTVGASPGVRLAAGALLDAWTDS